MRLYVVFHMHIFIIHKSNVFLIPLHGIQFRKNSRQLLFGIFVQLKGLLPFPLLLHHIDGENVLPVIYQIFVLFAQFVGFDELFFDLIHHILKLGIERQ